MAWAIRALFIALHPKHLSRDSPQLPQWRTFLSGCSPALQPMDGRPGCTSHTSHTSCTSHTRATLEPFSSHSPVNYGYRNGNRGFCSAAPSRICQPRHSPIRVRLSRPRLGQLVKPPISSPPKITNSSCYDNWYSYMNYLRPHDTPINI
jgi:hypothetical protein